MVTAWLLLASVAAVEAAALCAVVALADAAWWWGPVPVAVSLAGAAPITRSPGLSPREIREDVVSAEGDDPRLFAMTARLCAGGAGHAGTVAVRPPAPRRRRARLRGTARRWRGRGER
ncbi:hypothetical protein [Nocardiopsis sp. CC223A]|uniref:hypothetical protein n=1 Tax=Nocardiopsis sp. CC223A TaxID=3044051 RepID=UPI00278BEEB3|nr:hypothetical protein [Nocardiopsis sp. CC223A]